MVAMLSLTISLFSVIATVSAMLPDGRVHGNVPRRPVVPPVAAKNVLVKDVKGQTLAPLDTTYYFDQLIDHTNPSLGTFQQRYWTSSQYYEPGKIFQASFRDTSINSIPQVELLCFSHLEKKAQMVGSYLATIIILLTRITQGSPAT